MIAPTGDQFTIEAGGYRAVITQSGVLRELTHVGRHLVDGVAEDAIPDAGRGQLLAPWPNRIRDGRYVFDGVVRQLALTEPSRSNASHGLVRWVSWTVAGHTADRLELTYRLPAQTGYPWSLDLHTAFALDAAEGLSVTQTATNLAATAAPYACGAHPYLLAGPGPCDEWTIEVPASTYLVTDTERLLPVGRAPLTEAGLVPGEASRIGALVLDQAVTDLDRDAAGRAEVRLLADNGEGVALWVDAAHPWLQLYSGEATTRPRASVAVEPMTAPPDAFNSGDDLVVLQPGSSHAATWGVRAL